MTSKLLVPPSRGRLFKIFTDLGPYFRKLQSTGDVFFFDCLEICIDDSKEPEKREFLGWWLVLTRNENSFAYERFNGRYNLDGDWVDSQIKKKEQKQIDDSFDLFIARLKLLIEGETELCFVPLDVTLTEA
ncbi:MAG: sigma factor-binding protein Crl [Psychromonas sp.]